VHADHGAFHTKVGLLDTSRAWFAAKTNANLPGNPRANGLPTIQGVVLLFDAERGTPLAAMESGVVTLRRTAAGTAVAAKHLARADSKTLTIAGCGVQGRAHLEALTHVLALERVFACDVDTGVSRRFANECSSALSLEVIAIPAGELRRHTRMSDACVTCTTSTEFLLGPGDVGAGAFVAGVGVDSPVKRELEPALLAGSRVVVDVLEQCAIMGDLHHALEAGVMVREDVHGELGRIIAGISPGRTESEQTFVFDSTGTALQDIAAAAIVYERAIARGGCTDFDLRR
jgi:ornithine cyclodeaminase/alanine dehydrogenase-like protein (mu-crystallin family)